MDSFVRLIPKQGYEDYPAKLAKMSQLFGQAELLTVVNGQRRAATTHLSQENLNSLLPKLNRYGLIFTPLRKSGYYQGFAHTHKAVQPGDSFYWYGCVTRNLKDADAFVQADKAGDHNTTGVLLGFPPCCTKYFTDTFPKNYDPVWIELEGETQGYPECNQLLRYFGARISSCLSCSPTCKDTHESGKKWLATMAGIDEEVTAELVKLLSSPMVWSSYHGVVEVETDYFVGVTHTFPYLDKPRIIKWKVI